MGVLLEASGLVLALQLAWLTVSLVGSSASDHPLALSGGSASQRCGLRQPSHMISPLDNSAVFLALEFCTTYPCVYR